MMPRCQPSVPMRNIFFLSIKVQKVEKEAQSLDFRTVVLLTQDFFFALFSNVRYNKLAYQRDVSLNLCLLAFEFK